MYRIIVLLCFVLYSLAFGIIIYKQYKIVKASKNMSEPTQNALKEDFQTSFLLYISTMFMIGVMSAGGI